MMIRKLFKNEYATVNNTINTVNDSAERTEMTSENAFSAACQYVEANEKQTTFCSTELEGDVYEVVFINEDLQYDVFVDSNNGDVVGCSCEPVAA